MCQGCCRSRVNSNFDSRERTGRASFQDAWPVRSISIPGSIRERQTTGRPQKGPITCKGGGCGGGGVSGTVCVGRRSLLQSDAVRSAAVRVRICNRRRPARAVRVQQCHPSNVSVKGADRGCRVPIPPPLNGACGALALEDHCPELDSSAVHCEQRSNRKRRRSPSSRPNQIEKARISADHEVEAVTSEALPVNVAQTGPPECPYTQAARVGASFVLPANLKLRKNSLTTPAWLLNNVSVRKRFIVPDGNVSVNHDAPRVPRRP